MTRIEVAKSEGVEMIFPEKRVKQFLLTNGHGIFAEEVDLSY